MYYCRPEPKRTYTYKEFIPYGAGDIFSMDHFVESDFSGNVPDEIMKNGGTWDEEKMIMRLGHVPFYFRKQEE